MTRRVSWKNQMRLKYKTWEAGYGLDNRYGQKKEEEEEE